MHVFPSSWLSKPTRMPSAAAASSSVTPTVIELFQSQGCSSCPPTNATVLDLLDDPDVLVLTYDVTYWDYLGWKDTLANAAFDARQRGYARHLSQGTRIYTPQVIVDGRVHGVGNDARNLRALMAKASTTSTAPAVRLQIERSSISKSRQVRVSGTTGFGAVNLITYDASKQQVPISRGENGGRTLTHANVVRNVSRLGMWSADEGDGDGQVFSIPNGSVGGLQMAILVQEADDTGRIMGSARI